MANDPTTPIHFNGPDGELPPLSATEQRNKQKSGQTHKVVARVAAGSVSEGFKAPGVAPQAPAQRTVVMGHGRETPIPGENRRPTGQRPTPPPAPPAARRRTLADVVESQHAPEPPARQQPPQAAPARSPASAPQPSYGGASLASKALAGMLRKRN